MSVRVMSWVWENSASEGSDRLVLLAIADRANDDGSDAWPSVDWMATKARVSERTVQRSIRHLVALGELEVAANAGRRGTNVYRVLMGRQPVTPDNVAPPTDSHPRQDDGATSTTEGVTPTVERGDTRVTRTIQEPSLTIQQNTSATAAASTEVVKTRQDIERLCTRLADRIEANGSKRPRIAASWRTAARLLLDVDERTEKQVATAIDWCQGHEFWRANILSMPKLREQYERLRLEAARKPGSASRQQDVDDKFARAAKRMGVTK